MIRYQDKSKNMQRGEQNVNPGVCLNHNVCFDVWFTYNLGNTYLAVTHIIMLFHTDDLDVLWNDPLLNHIHVSAIIHARVLDVLMPVILTEHKWQSRLPVMTQYLHYYAFPTLLSLYQDNACHIYLNSVWNFCGFCRLLVKLQPYPAQSRMSIFENFTRENLYDSQSAKSKISSYTVL